MSDAILCGSVVGVLSAGLTFAICTAVRNSYVRIGGGASYHRGWQDCLKKVNEVLRYSSVTMPEVKRD